MKTERIEIYGRGFPRGFTHVGRVRRILHANLSGLPKSHFPRLPKEGEILVDIQVDPNGEPYQRGDVVLSVSIDSKAMPELSERRNYEIVQIKSRFTTGNGEPRRSHPSPFSDFLQWHRYALLRPAKTSDSAACAKAVSDRLRALGRQTIDTMMSSRA